MDLALMVPACGRVGGKPKPCWTDGEPGSWVGDWSREYPPKRSSRRSRDEGHTARPWTLTP